MSDAIQIGAEDQEWLRQASALAQSCAQGGGSTATMNGGNAVLGPRRTVIGLGSSGAPADITAAGTTAFACTIRATPGFVGRRLIVPESKARRTLAALAQMEAGDLTVTALSVNNGVTNVMSSADEIPSEVFSSLAAVPGVMPFPYAPQNSTINASVKNYGTATCPDVLLAVEGAIL
jgi:hypothetical protein